MAEETPPPAYGGPPPQYKEPPVRNAANAGIPDTGTNFGEQSIALQPIIHPQQIIQPVQIHIQPPSHVQAQNCQILTQQQQMISYDQFVCNIN